MTTTGVDGSGNRALTRKGQATRARIVAAAAELMFRDGVAGTTTDAVQAAAGVSGSQLYHYFSNKSELVRAVIAHQTDAVLGSQQPLLGRLDSMEALHAWADRMVVLQQQRQCRGGCPIGSLASELAEAGGPARGDLADGFARWEGAIRDGLRAMRDRGELRAEADPGRLATAGLAAVQGGLLLTQVRRTTVPLEAALETFLAQLHALAPAGAPSGVSAQAARALPAAPPEEPATA